LVWRRQLLQPFVNYNMEEGWYLVSSPIITANWEASSGNKWAFPLGAGIGKIFRDGPSAPNCNSCFRDSAAAVRDMPFVGEN
jgi:hypothetical protein